MEKPNKTIIEMASINKLKDALLRTGSVEPDIRENDKTPSWDGELRLYRSQKSFSKDSLIGNIPIQVKGTWVDRFAKNRATFQAEVSDLKNYQNDGGALFFLVQIKDFDQYRIYFSSLLPFDLRRLLDSAKEQDTKRIQLEPFPYTDPDGMLRLLSEFITNKRKQGTLLPNIKSMQDLDGAPFEIDELQFSVCNIGLKTQEDVFKAMLQNPFYIYAKPQNIEASFVVDKVLPEQLITHQDLSVEVNGEILYDNVDFIQKADGSRQFKLGESLTFSIRNGHLDFSYNSFGTLNEQIRSMKVIVALVQNQKFKIGNHEIAHSNVTLNGHTSEEVASRLTLLQRAQKALEKLHVKKDLALGVLSDEDLQKLWALVSAILDHSSVPLTIDGDGGVGTLEIGNIKILLAIKKSTAGAFEVDDYFSVQNVILTQDKGNPQNGFPVSPYILLNLDFLETVDNFNLEDMVPSITSYPYTDIYGYKIILLILELLKYYDNKKDGEILDAVIQLLNFIQKNDHENEELYQINRLQTEKRRRKLTKEEIQYLMSLKQSVTSPSYQLAATILLESFSEAQVIYEQLEEPERKEFDQYPIKNLWIRV